MNDDRQGEASQVERIERCCPKLEGLSVGCRCKQVDRIPNASLFEETVKACEYRHGHAACQPAFNSCRNRIGFERKQGPREVWCNRKPFDFASRSRDYGRFLSNFDRLFLLVWEDIPEPPDTSGHDEDCSKNADRSARKQSCKKQSDAKRKNDGPRCRRRQINRAWRDLRYLRS